MMYDETELIESRAKVLDSFKLNPKDRMQLVKFVDVLDYISLLKKEVQELRDKFNNDSVERVVYRSYETNSRPFTKSQRSLIYKYDLDGNKLAVFRSMREASQDLGRSKYHILKVIDKDVELDGFKYKSRRDWAICTSCEKEGSLEENFSKAYVNNDVQYYKSICKPCYNKRASRIRKAKRDEKRPIKNV